MHNFDPHCPRCVKRRDDSARPEDYRALCHFRCPWRGQPADAAFGGVMAALRQSQRGRDRQPADDLLL